MKFHFRQIRVGASVLLCAGVLAACQSPTKVYFWGGSYEDAPRSEYIYAIAESDAKTTIIGTPFPGQRAATERAVLSAMNIDDKNRLTNFTTAPKRTNRNYHIVMAFNPAGFGQKRDLCSGEPRLGGANQGGQIELVAVFCDANRLVFAFRGVHPAINGPDDPLFRSFVRDLMFYFVPSAGLTDDDDPD